MKKDLKAPRKLTLNRETLRQLEGAYLQTIAAGSDGPPSAYCPTANQVCTETRRTACY